MSQYTVQLSDSALSNYLLCYSALVHTTTTDVKQFLSDIHVFLKTVISVNLGSMYGVKFWLNISCEFVRSTHERETTIAYFSKCQCAVLHESEIDVQLTECYEHIKSEAENFEYRGSNWILVTVKRADMHVSKFEPLRAGTFVKLPDWLIYKRAVVNVENFDDNKCFMWSILAGLHPPACDVKTKSRVNLYQQYQGELSFEGIEFPVKVSDIAKFEQLNDISVNVYSVDRVEGRVFPTHLTRQKRNKHVNLVLHGQHYAWVRNLDRMLGDQTKHKARGYHCEMCLFRFHDANRLAAHVPHCSSAHPCKNPSRIEMPEPGENRLKFDNFQKLIRRPRVVYVDFECILESYQQPQPPVANSEKRQKHIPCAFGALATTSCCDNKVHYDAYKSYTGEDCVEKFLLYAITLAERATRELNRKKNLPILSPAELALHKSRKACWICGKALTEKKVIDHCHLCGKYRGAAHAACNIKVKLCTDLAVVCHNLRRYDGHLLMSKIGALCRQYSLSMSCVAKGTEDYISFTISRATSLFRNRKRSANGVKEDGFRITFLDSCQFMPASLDALVSNLPPDGLDILTHGFSGGGDVGLLKRKGLFPYDYLDSWKKLDQVNPPSQTNFHNKLTNTDISDDDYAHVLKVWKSFDVKSLRDYMELYLKCDVYQTAAVCEGFRAFSMDNFHLDPFLYCTSPGLAWDACLRFTDVELELLTDPDMYVFFEEGIRGGVSTICKRYAKANNPYLADYDPSQPTSYLLYVDANNLYGWAMEQPLPMSDFRWLDDTEIAALNICSVEDDSEVGYVLEVDLRYPSHLHDEHNCFPLAPERLKVNADMLSVHCRELLGEEPHIAAEKLTPNLYDKERYIVHYRNLKFYLEMGMELAKIHRVISFRQAAWMVPYIRFNTEKRKVAKSIVGKNNHKLFNNAVFGKSMQNVRLYINVKLVTDKRRFAKLVKRKEFVRATIFAEGLVAVRMQRLVTRLDKAIYTGLTVLEDSKRKMQRHHYKIVVPRYGLDAQVCMTDTDSFMYHIFTEDIYKDILEMNDVYDTSDYPPDHFLFTEKNKKVVGKMKDETAGDPIEEFVGLRAKMYSFRCNGKDHKRAKGVKRDVVQRKLHHSDYVDILRGKTHRHDDMQMIRSYLHQLYTINVHKKSLASFDDKRYILPDGVNTLAYGHYRTREGGGGGGAATPTI